MARKLNQYVTVSNAETGESATFGPDDEVPSWAEGLITAEGVWEGDDVDGLNVAGDPGNSGVSDPEALKADAERSEIQGEQPPAVPADAPVRRARNRDE